MQRKYRITDESLVSHARKMVSHFDKHKEAFNHFNSVKYGDGFSEKLQHSVNNAALLISNPETLSVQKQLSKEVRDLIKELVKSLQYIRVHVNDTYEDNPTKVEEFNLAKITVHSPNPDSFISFCKQSLGVVALNCKALINNGLREDILDKVISQLDYLHELRKKQLDAIKKRSSATAQRVSTLNNLWTTIRKLRDAAQYVFPDNPESASLFELPKNAYGKRGKMQPAQES